MMLGIQRASVGVGRGREGGLVKGTSEDGTGRGMDMDSMREEASRGRLSEEGREHWSKGGKRQGRYPEEGIGQYIHKPSDNASLAIDTLLLQMNNGEQVYIINSVYCLSGG